MNDTKRRRTNRKRATHNPNIINAVCVTVYDPTGATIPAEVRTQIEESVFQVACDHRLLINIALT